MKPLHTYYAYQYPTTWLALYRGYREVTTQGDDEDYLKWKEANKEALSQCNGGICTDIINDFLNCARNQFHRKPMEELYVLQAKEFLVSLGLNFQNVEILPRREQPDRLPMDQWVDGGD